MKMELKNFRSAIGFMELLQYFVFYPSPPQKQLRIPDAGVQFSDSYIQ